MNYWQQQIRDRQARHPFTVLLGGAYDVLDPLIEPWGDHYDRPLRPAWEKTYRMMRRYLGRVDRENRDEVDILAHMVARVLDEMADHLGDDRRMHQALEYAVVGDVRPGSAEELTLAEVRTEWGAPVLSTIIASVREAVFDERPRKR
jgi:hypothetical protein